MFHAPPHKRRPLGNRKPPTNGCLSVAWATGFPNGGRIGEWVSGSPAIHQVNERRVREYLSIQLALPGSGVPLGAPSATGYR